jgi:hypothetical protein
MSVANADTGKVKPYRELVGFRPDIAFAVNRAARNFLNPTKGYWKAAQRIFRYLVNTKRYRFYYPRNVTFALEDFCGSDYAGRLRNRSATEYIFTANKTPVVEKYIFE